MFALNRLVVTGGGTFPHKTPQKFEINVPGKF